MAECVLGALSKTEGRTTSSPLHFDSYGAPSFRGYNAMSRANPSPDSLGVVGGTPTPDSRFTRRLSAIAIGVAIALAGVLGAFFAPIHSGTWTLRETAALPEPLAIAFPYGSFVTVGWSITSASVLEVYIQSPSGAELATSSSVHGSTSFVAQAGQYMLGLDWSYSYCQRLCPPSCDGNCSPPEPATATFTATWAIA